MKIKCTKCLKTSIVNAELFSSNIHYYFNKIEEYKVWEKVTEKPMDSIETNRLLSDLIEISILINNCFECDIDSINLKGEVVYLIPRYATLLSRLGVLLPY